MPAGASCPRRSWRRPSRSAATRCSTARSWPLWGRCAACGARMLPGGARRRNRMGGMTVPVAVVSSRMEAELIVGLLSSNGLRAAVSADDAGGQDPQLQLQGVQVLVAPADQAAARQILADARAT